MNKYEQNRNGVIAFYIQQIKIEKDQKLNCKGHKEEGNEQKFYVNEKNVKNQME